MSNLLLEVVEGIARSRKKSSASFEERDDLVSKQMEDLLMVDDFFIRLLETIYHFFDGHEYCQSGLVGANKLIGDQLETNIVHSWVHWLRNWLILVVEVLHHLAWINVLSRQVVCS